MKEGDLKYLNEYRLPQFLNQLGLDLRAGDKTPQSLRLESMDAKTLVDKVTGQNGLTEDKLIAFQGKLALDQAKAEKAKASEAEQVKAVHAEKEADELNTAVLYDEKGKAVN